mmetsp:Transcript_2402/g.8567  ORF Transcript_2402/g.8567 Transcript_2402/m.8567 type:complete len:462 (-) Transcript_2402:28-1413(-)
MSRFRKSMGDLRRTGKVRASVALFKGGSIGQLETIEDRRLGSSIISERRRVASSLRLDTLGQKEQKRRLRCTAVESDERSLDVNCFCVPLGSAIEQSIVLSTQLHACEWLEHPNILMLAFDRYVRFMELRRDHPTEELAAPIDVRCVWMTHMKRPLLYATDIRDGFGDAAAFAHPTLSTSTSESIAATRALWQSTFGEPWDFEDVVESLALRYEEYHTFCAAGYEELTSPAPALSRFHTWLRFGISTLHVLQDRKQFSKQTAVCLNGSYDLEALANGTQQLTQGFINSLILAYNRWIVRVAQELLTMETCAVAFEPPFVPDPFASLSWDAHMYFPREYASDCKRTFGGLLMQLRSPAIDAVGRDLTARMRRFFNLPAPDYDPQEDSPEARALAAEASAAVVAAQPARAAEPSPADPVPAPALAPAVVVEVLHSDPLLNYASSESDDEFDEEYDSDYDAWEF